MAANVRPINDAPEFPCDQDLEPFIKSGQLDAWQAMAITSCRAASEARATLAELQKKMDELSAQAPPPARASIGPRPVFCQPG